MKYYTDSLINYFNIKGRATRKEFWVFFLFNIIFNIIVRVLDYILLNLGGFNFTITFGFGYLTLIYTLWLIIPSFTICIRRLHDINKSGVNLLFALIPLVGAVILLIFYCTDSFPADNKWGPKKN